MRFALALLFIFATHFAAAEESSYRWVQRLGGSDTDSVVGIGTDSQGSIYVAGTTNSLDFPVRNAIQTQRGGAPLYRGSITGGPAAKLYSPNAWVGSVAISRCRPGAVFAASAAGFLQSTDSGESWSKSPLPLSSNAQIAATCHGSNDLVFAVADKLFRTSDLKTWQPMSILNARVVYRLWVDPNDPLTIFANTDQGLARSRDAGDTWKITGGIALNLSFVAGEPGVLYAPALAYYFSMGPAKSTDYGDTWTPLAELPGRDNRPSAVIRDPRRPNVLYASGFYVSEDSGQTWTFRDTGVSNFDIDYTTGTLLGIRTDNRNVVASTDGFVTKTPVISNGPNIGTISAANGVVFVSASLTSNVFVAKYSPAGELLYSTYFGGSGQDSASAMAVGKDGAVYVAGTTQSLDFPTTPNAYIRSTLNYSPFLFKLDSAGQTAFSTIVDSQALAIAIAPDGGILLAGTSRGGLVTTPGAYQTNFSSNVTPSKFFQPTNAFVQRFSPDGSALEFGTYLGANNATGAGMGQGPDGSIYVAGNGLFRLSADGSKLIATATITPTFSGESAVAVDSAGVVYTFQNNTLARWTDTLQQTAQSPVRGTSLTKMALDRDGRPLLSGTAGIDFPTAVPLQGPFNTATGLLAAFQSDLTPKVATFVGDTRPFQAVAAAGLPDGGVVFTGGTLQDYSQPNTNTQDVFVAALDLRVPPVRLDAIRNAASFVANPVAAYEALVLTGGPFADDAAVTATIEGTGLTVPLTILSRSASAITLQMGADVPAKGTLWWSVTSGGQQSNTVKMPLSAASPGIYTTNGTGTGLAVAFDKDGVANGANNPAVLGEPLTVYVAGAPLNLMPAFYLGGFYANGIDARLEPAEGLPGLVYKLSVFLPPEAEVLVNNPNVKPPAPPPTLNLRLVIGDVSSQTDAVIYVKAK